MINQNSNIQNMNNEDNLLKKSQTFAKKLFSFNNHKNNNKYNVQSVHRYQ